MNDKEKQIEKLANIIANCRFTDPKSEAIDLYNAKCRIIPEDSVVLTKEELKKIIQEEYQNALIQEEYQNALKDKVVLTREEWAQRVPFGLYQVAKVLYNGKCAELKQSRKETARELLTAQLKECIEAEKRVLKIRKNKDDLYYNGFSLAITNLKMYIKELAKEYKVEIGEEVWKAKK